MKRLAGIVAFVIVALGVGVFTYILKKQREKQEKLDNTDEILVSTLENVEYPSNHQDKKDLEYPEADSISSI